MQALLLYKFSVLTNGFWDLVALSLIGTQDFSKMNLFRTFSIPNRSLKYEVSQKDWPILVISFLKCAQ